VGWTGPQLPAGVVVGTDHNSYSFDDVGKELVTFNSVVCHMILQFLLVNCVYQDYCNVFYVLLLVFVALKCLTTVNTPTQGPTTSQDIILRLIM